MFPYLVAGATYAFAAAVQPGPYQAFLISSTLANGWRRTLPALFAPILSDIPVVCLVLILLTQLSPLFLNILRLAGGIFLLYLAAGAFRSYRNYRQEIPAEQSPARKTVLRAALVNFLNPNPYLGWSLIMGPLFLDAWNHAPAYGITLIASFYCAIILVNALILSFFARARSLGPRVGRLLVGLSALALAGFGLYQLWSGISLL